jgi:hypothetical protein
VPLPEVTFGQEDTEQLTATVQSSLTQTLSGPVAITAVDGNGSSTLICRQFVRVDGTIACPLGASLLPTGDYQLTATYTGDAGHDGSVSDPQPSP